MKLHTLPVWGLALALTLGASPLQATGRLFHTPAEREVLDRGKYHQALGKGRHPYQGRVKRSLGPETYWVNGQPQNDAPAPDESPGGDLLRGGQLLIHPARKAPP